MISLHDTASGRVQPLEPIHPGRVSMYVCGPTVYDLPHLGHGRSVLVYDILRRFLEASGLVVTLVSNITDVDDKIVDRAKLSGQDPAELAAYYEQQWWAAVDALGVARPSAAPRATEYLDQMAQLIKQLLDRGAAYVADDGVYFASGRVADYGLLSGQTSTDRRAGARVELSQTKLDQSDFALWKRMGPDEYSYPSAFGAGRPGWHTECVAMSTDILGPEFDLHAGGLDLCFPHHENERAQAMALGLPFARRWMHHAFVVAGGSKMSKSLGNFETLTDLLARADDRALRLLVLRAQYRRPMEIGPSHVADAEAALRRLDALTRRLDVPVPDGGEDALAMAMDLTPEAAERFIYCMENDLDCPGAMATVFELVSKANELADSGRAQQATAAATAARALSRVVGLDWRDGREPVGDAAQQLARERDRARAERKWTRADELRDQLVALGYRVEDTPGGTLISRL